MKRPPEKPYRFTLIEYGTFIRNEPRASWSGEFEARQILNGPRRKAKYVIYEFIYSFPSNCYYICSFFRSEESMRRAFFNGVRRYTESALMPPPPKKKKLRTFSEILTEALEEYGPKPNFNNEPGCSHTIILENFEVPWFLAEKGQRIRGDIAVPLPKCNSRATPPKSR